MVRQWTLTPSCVGPNPTSPTLCKIYMQFFVYILKSVKDDKFYIGQTNNLTDRFLRKINNGEVYIYYQKVILPMLFLTLSSYLIHLFK